MEKNDFFKERNPKDTIQIIRNILSENDIFVIENKWFNKSDCYYSLSLEVYDTPFSVNGKGITPELALASAYGELMERMQNLSIYKLIYHDIYKKSNPEISFSFVPDEKLINCEEFFENKNSWLKHQLLQNENGNLDKVKDVWKQMSMVESKDDFICLPFYSLKNKSLDYVPLIMLSKLYTSNGMAAGNTMEEAIVQGISEIYERYATKKIIKENITPPDIPYNEINKDRLLKKMILNIQSSGKYKLYFKDCSLGIGIPVVAAICVDVNTGKYFVKFGAHPVFSIAIQRTLTELLQGQNIDEIKGMRYFLYDDELATSNDNIYGIFVNGCGVYSSSFFAKKTDYEYKPFKKHNNENNKELLNSMIQDIKLRSWDLFIRDVSFLGFPSCQILISGISEVEDFNDVYNLNKYLNYCNIKKDLLNVATLSKNKILELANKIQKNKSLQNGVPFQWLNLNEKNGSWIYNNINFILAGLYVIVDEYKKSAQVLTNFINKIDKYMQGKEVCYLSCVSNVLNMLADDFDENEIYQALNIFYSKQMIHGALNEFSKENIYNVFNTKDNASTADTFEEQFNKLKRIYENNVVNQMELSNILN